MRTISTPTGWDIRLEMNFQSKFTAELVANRLERILQAFASEILATPGESGWVTSQESSFQTTKTDA